MPRWVSEGYAEYAKRVPRECSLHLTEIPAGRRGKRSDAQRVVTQEGERMLKAIPRDSRVIAMDVGGSRWSTEELAARLDSWLSGGRDVSLLVGGPDGLSPSCLDRADGTWSLSPLTFPHPLVRVVLAEQIYRAWTLLKGHPYHRA